MRRTAFLAGALAAGTLPALAQSPVTLTVGTAVDSPTQLPLYLSLTHTFAPQGLNVSMLSFRGDTECRAGAGG